MSVKRRFDPGPGSRYGLKRIKSYLKEGKFHITETARESANSLFEWGTDDILKALRKLQPKHCTKRVPFNGNPDIAVEHFKARGINGEDIYVHLHIDPDFDKLIIGSFKEY